jgi:hypothetical protein
VKSALFITVLVLALSATGVAQKESVAEIIRKLDSERIQAQIHADAVALDRICAADFIGVPPENRPNWLSLPRCENF